jgi:lysophospholipase L1-like esterase
LPLLLIALIAVGACRKTPPNLDSPGRTIVCFGDSITAGTGVGPGEAYPDLLAKRLNREVVNAGVPGETAAEGLARVDQVLAENPWLVIVELGGNDILRRTPPEEMEKSLRAILDRLLAARVVPLVVEVDAPFAASYHRVFERLQDDYPAIPFEDEALGKILRDASLKSDSVHPNALGQHRLATALTRMIEPLLEEREPKWE